MTRFTCECHGLSSQYFIIGSVALSLRLIDETSSCPSWFIQTSEKTKTPATISHRRGRIRGGWAALGNPVRTALTCAAPSYSHNRLAQDHLSFIDGSFQPSPVGPPRGAPLGPTRRGRVAGVSSPRNVLRGTTRARQRVVLPDARSLPRCSPDRGVFPLAASRLAVTPLLSARGPEGQWKNSGKSQNSGNRQQAPVKGVKMEKQTTPAALHNPWPMQKSPG